MTRSERSFDRLYRRHHGDVYRYALAVLRNRDFILYLIGRFVASFGQQMLTVAVGWELYERTGKALALAFADYNDSGRQSLVIANDEVPGDFLKNVGGKFANIGSSSGVAVYGALLVVGGTSVSGPAVKGLVRTDPLRPVHA